nr:M15 family metallopeptidase [uncultured Acetatifactor sp.]
MRRNVSLKKVIGIFVLSGMVFLLGACTAATKEPGESTAESRTDAENSETQTDDATEEAFAGSTATANEEPGIEDETAAVEEISLEEEAVEETQKLESLDGLDAGTILNPDQLELSDPGRYFTGMEIIEGDSVYERINGKSYQENPYISLDSLRYLKMLHYNFEGNIQVGEMIVNESIEDDILSIFQTLFEEKYEIQSMYLVDRYWTGNADDSDTASVDANNTSAFCYREITGGGNLSNHAYGLAVDINPQQNPYVSYSTGVPVWWHSNANDYIDREAGLEHMITHDDLAYQLFTEYGFEWGGDWNNPKDYQHFDKN